MNKISSIRKGSRKIVEINFDSLQSDDIMFHKDGYWLRCCGAPMNGVVMDADGDAYVAHNLQSNVKPYVEVSSTCRILYIPGARHIERNDMLDDLDYVTGFSLAVGNDIDAALLAMADGVKLINDMPGVPAGRYIDTPENRKVIEAAIKKDPSLMVSENEEKLSRAVVGTGNRYKAALLAVLNAIEDEGFNVDIYNQEGKGDCGIEIEAWTDNGVDMIHFIDLRDAKETTDIFAIFDEIGKIAAHFDPEEEIRVHMEDNSFRSAFTYRQAGEDFENWGDKLNALAGRIDYVVDCCESFLQIERDTEQNFSLSDIWALASEAYAPIVNDSVNVLNFESQEALHQWLEEKKKWQGSMVAFRDWLTNLFNDGVTAIQVDGEDVDYWECYEAVEGEDVETTEAKGNETQKSSLRNCDTCAKKDNCSNRLDCLAGVIPCLWEPGINYVPDIPNDDPGDDTPMAVMIERSHDDGITKKDIMGILHEMELLGFADDEEYVPLYIEAETSYAFGLMAMSVADECLNFEVDQNSDFAKAAIAVMDDMALETPNKLYTFDGVRTLLHR